MHIRWKHRQYLIYAEALLCKEQAQLLEIHRMKLQEKQERLSMTAVTMPILGFVGFAPYDNPQISICVILEGGYTKGG